MRRKTVKDILDMKAGPDESDNNKKISAVTSYDYTMATLCDRAGIDILLVGDSAGMVMLGHENTAGVTMDEMCMFTKAVSRARKNSLLVADLPFMSYQADMRDALINSGKLISAGADAVKLEGGASMAGTIDAITNAGIPVMGHIGLQPQTTTLMEGYRVQARTSDAAIRLIKDAEELQKAGAFCIVLEMVSREVAEIITEVINIPTIGIGSGAGCDGQVLVIQDLLGMYDRIIPKFVKRYANLSEEIIDALTEYKNEVKAGTFPAEENTFPMDAEHLKRLREDVKKGYVK